MNKPINLRKAVERKGVHYLNILVQFGRVKFEMFISRKSAEHYATDGWVTRTITDAVREYPQFFTYK